MVLDQPEDGEELLLSILPSYQMHQSTISRDLTPSSENFRVSPPMYELTPETSPLVSPAINHDSMIQDGYFPAQSNSSSAQAQAPHPAGAAQQTHADTFTRFEDTLLANSHKLKRLNTYNEKLANDIKIKISITENIPKVGVKSKVVEPEELSRIELKQGDYIHGVLTVTNAGTDDIPFEMFAVLFEGIITLEDGSSKPVLHKFLNLFDFNASWNDGYLDRLSTDDHRNPHGPYTKNWDQSDNTVIDLSFQKVLEPGVTYKKFFTFKIPQKLLESVCETHGLVKHMQLPPTMGGSKLEDFCFLNCSVVYSVNAKLIARASEYGVNLDCDEYMVGGEESCELRVIPNTNNVFESNREMINQESMLVYKNLVQEIEEKVEELKGGNTALSSRRTSISSIDAVVANSVTGNNNNNNTNNNNVNGSAGGNVNPLLQMSPMISPMISPIGSPSAETFALPTSSRPKLTTTPSTTELRKLRQSYYATQTPQSTSSLYEIFMQYRKKSILGTKIIGLVALSMPKGDIKVSYQPTEATTPSLVRIPLDLHFIFSDKAQKKAPDFRHISVELVSLTIKAKKHPISSVLTHEHLFENKPSSHDCFEYLTILKFQKYAVKLSQIIKQYGGPEVLGPNAYRLIEDVKSIANLGTKYDYMKIEKVVLQSRGGHGNFLSLQSIPWEEEQIGHECKYTKRFDVIVDLNSIVDPGKEFTLVPDFQSCYLIRMYYLKVHIKCPNGDNLTMKVPIVLQRR
ncbi:hypothetical protein CAAN3_10S03334 [[Candida] anglica]